MVVTGDAGHRRTGPTNRLRRWALATGASLVVLASVPGAAAGVIPERVAAGWDNACAVTDDGAVWCWGAGPNGEGTPETGPTAVRVEKAGGGNLTGATVVTVAGGHACALTDDGAAWCWGGNGWGQLGDGTKTDRDRAVRVAKSGGNALVDVVAISAGSTHTGEGAHNANTCAITDDGSAWCWGGNDRGQLGDGTRTDRTRAVRVKKSGGGQLSRVKTIGAAGLSSCASTRAGAAWCWGNNMSGQLGDGTRTERTRAVRVKQKNGDPLADVTSVSAGGLSSCAVTAARRAWCWGANGEGGLGDGSTKDRIRAVGVTKQGGARLTGVTSISAYSTLTQDPLINHACARTNDGAAWCWGDNYRGLLGVGDESPRKRATRVTRSGGSALDGVVSIDTDIKGTCATAGGSAWCWGDNFYYQVGDGTDVDRFRAVEVTVL